MNTSVNTHDYDTKLTKIIKTKKYVSNDEYKLFIDSLHQLNNYIYKDKIIDKNLKINAQKTINLVANDRNNNFDEKNHIHFELLFPIIWDKIRNKNNNSLYHLFIEQLSDILTNGSCSQGRTTRILQFYDI